MPMRYLLPGVHSFQRDVFPQRRRQFEQLATGQSPRTLLITCSDSRVVPHLLTQSEPGDVFVLRNAGNLVPPYESEASGEAATIEYALKALKVQELIVCGHSHCGAVTGILRPELINGMAAVEKWLAHAQRVRRAIAEQKLPSDLDDDELTSAIKANVLVQLDQLRAYPCVAEAETRGEVALYGWFYRFETGQVFEFDPNANRFVDVATTLTTTELVG